jgi:uncharacterized protein (DUF2147 family)
MKRASLSAVLFVFLLSSAAAFGADIQGTWLRDNGEMQVKFDKCGDALCGDVVWIKSDADTKAKIGQRIFFDMKPDGADAWTGKAQSPSDGTTYAGKISMTGAALTTSGCIIGGLVCKSAQWSRVH